MGSAASKIDQRPADIGSRIGAIKVSAIDPEDVSAALAEFEPVWEVLQPNERTRVAHLLIESAEYDSRSGGLTMVFRVGGAPRIMAEAEDN